MLLPGSDGMGWTPWLPCWSVQAMCHAHPGSAVRVERCYQVLSDRRSAPSLDLMPLEHVDQLTVLQKADLWRRRPVPGEIAAGAGGSIDVLSRKDRGQRARHALVLEGQGDRGTRVACGAAADRVDHDQC